MTSPEIRTHVLLGISDSHESRHEETNSQRLFWEKQAQKSCDIERDRVALNLQPNKDGLLECRGRIQGEYPVYIPETSMLGLRLVEQAHQETLHGGVGLPWPSCVPVNGFQN